MKPNIFFIIIDSLRFDKCYGENKTSITPNIDNLIKNGVNFTNAICSAPATAVSISSIFSGLYPFNTGMGGNTYQKFNPNLETYVKLLKENGYHVYATTPKIAVDFGLTCDFENPDAGYNNYFSLFSGLGDQIFQKISEYQFQEPWFFYIHLFDLHSPVVVPPDFNTDNFGDSQYEKMISAIDFWLGKFLNKIDMKNTLVILTADHGDYVPVVKLKDETINLEPTITEKTLWRIGNKLPSNVYPIKKKFGEILQSTRKKIKDSKIKSLDLTPYQTRILTESRMGGGHRLFDDLIHVPLIFSGLSMPSKTINQQVKHVDLFPTIFNILNLNSKNTDGTSLLPLINDILSEEIPAYIESPPEINQTTFRAHGIRTSKFKYLRSYDEKNNFIELYNLEKDPLEEYNIAENEPEIIEEYENILQKILINKNNQEKTQNENVKIEDELKKLGYV